MRCTRSPIPSCRRRIELPLSALALALLVAPVGMADGDATPDIAGIYEMEGETTVEGSLDRFLVTGKLVIRQEGARARISVDGAFRRVEGNSGPAGVALIGRGEILLEGDRFEGTAEVQTIMSEIPEIDVSAAYMPKKFGPTLDSVASGRVMGDGELRFEIKSEVIGEGFTLPEGRTTVIRAKRVARSATELKKPR